MQSLEKDILAILEADSRTPIDRIGAMLGIPTERAREEVKKLEDKGLILKYTAIVNSEEVDANRVEAIILVKATPQKGEGFDAIAREIAKQPEVKDLYLVSGDYDIAVIVEGSSLKNIAHFVSEHISAYGTVHTTTTHFILKKYKVEGALMKKEGEAGRLSVQP